MKRIDTMIGERAAEEFFEWARKLGVYDKEAAARLGIDRKSPYEWRNGEFTPSTSALQKMAFNGLDVIYILTGKRQGGKA